jgi:hypothetical protein
MGPPIATLDEGQWSFGAEYGYETIDLRACGTFGSVYAGTPFDFVESLRIEDLEMNMLFGNLAYGVCDNWDLFVRLGAADASGDMKATADVADFGVVGEYSLGNLDSDPGFAWGAGTRATFCRSGPWSFGGLMQVTWFYPGDSDIKYVDPVIPPGPGDVTQVGEASIELWQGQVALAVAYQMDTVRLWAGPFLQFIDGDLDRSGSVLFDGDDFGDTFSASADLEQESEFGAHFGVSWQLASQWNLWGEGQVTGDSWLVGVGLVVMTQESFGK